MLATVGQVNKTQNEFTITSVKTEQVDHNLVVSRTDETRYLQGTIVKKNHNFMYH